MRIRCRVVGLASLVLAGSLFAGCSGDGDTIFPASSGPAPTHIIDAVGIRTTTGATGSNYVPNDGVDGASAAITINVDGDDFSNSGNAANLVVALAEVNVGEFNSSVAGVTTGTTAFPFSYLPVTHTLVDQSLITFTMPTTSPLTTVTGDVRVVVLQSGLPNDVKTSASVTSLDVLHLTATAQNGGGLTATLAVTGDTSAAFAVGYPGQSGILMTSTITNNTGEPVKVDSLTGAGANGNIAFGPTVHNYLVDPLGFTILNGASSSVRFVVAHTEDALNAAASGTVSFATTGQGASSGIARIVSATATFTQLASPRIQAIGGSLLTQGGSADIAGVGGTVSLGADGAINIGTATTVTSPGNPTFGSAGAVSTAVLTDKVAAAGDDHTFAHWEINGGAARTTVTLGTGVTQVVASGTRTLTFNTTNTITASNGSFVTDGFTSGQSVMIRGTTANNGTFTISGVATTVLTVSGTPFTTTAALSGGETLDGAADRNIIVQVNGDVDMQAVDFRLTGNSGDTIQSLDIRATGYIHLSDVRFYFNGTNLFATTGFNEENGTSLTLTVDDGNAKDGTLSKVLLDNVTIDTYGGNVVNSPGGSGGSVTITGGPTGTLTGSPGDVTLATVTVNASGGTTAAAVSAGGAGGSFGVLVGGDTVAANTTARDGDIRVASTCTFNLAGGHNLSNALTSGDAGPGGNFSLKGFEDNTTPVNGSVDDGNNDGCDIVFNGRVITDGGDYGGLGGALAAAGGAAGTVTLTAGGDLSIGGVGGNATIITNGGSASIPGGFGGTGTGGNAGAITIHAGNALASGGNGVSNDGEVLIQGSSALVAIGGASDDGNAGNGGSVTIYNNDDSGVSQDSGLTFLPSLIAGTIVTDGGYTRPDTFAAAGLVCGAAGNIAFAFDADITVTGHLMARGGSLALDGAPALGTAPLQACAGGAGGTIVVDTTLDGGGNAGSPVVTHTASTFHGDLVFSGTANTRGGGVMKSAATGDTGGVGGSIYLVADGGSTATAGLLDVSGVAMSNGGPVFYGNGAGATAGAAGLVTVSATLAYTTATHSSGINLASTGILRADGGDYKDAQGVAVYGTAGTVTVSSIDDATGGNNGDVTIAGNISARGDNGGGDGVFVLASNGAANEDSDSNLIVSGTIETAETTHSAANTRCNIVLTADDGNLTVSGSLLGNRSIIEILHSSDQNGVTGGNQTLITGTIINDHRDVSTGTSHGSITITSGANQSGTTAELLISGATLTCNAGTITLDSYGGAGVNNKIEIVTSTINVDAVENSLLELNSVNNLGGGTITIGGGTTTADVAYTSGTISANGGETLSATTPFDSLGAGVGGTVSITAQDTVTINSTISANGKDQTANATRTEGAGGNSAGGTVTLASRGAGAAAGGLSITSSVTATGGNRSVGGLITLGVDTTGGGAIHTLVTSAASSFNADAGDNAFVDAGGQPLDASAVTAGSNTSILIADSGTDTDDTMSLAGTFSANGGDNAGGAAGFGGLFQVQSNSATANGVSVTATISVNGGSSTANSGYGGLGGTINFSGVGLVYAANTDFAGATMSANGGAGTSAGGDAGTVYLDNDTDGGTVFVTFSTSTTTINLAGGTGSPAGLDGLFVLNDSATTPVIPTTNLSITAGATQIAQ